MANRHARVCLICGVVFIVSAGIFRSLPASGRDYLPRVGPVPLQFSKPEPSTKATVFQLLETTKATVSPAKSTAGVSPITTPPPSSIPNSQTTNTANSDTNTQSSAVITNADLLPVNSSGTNRFIVLSSIPEPAKMTEPGQSANDLLSISPDMLIYYFKSNRFKTNQANVSGLVPLQFIPPTTAISGSSRAVYQVR